MEVSVNVLHFELFCNFSLFVDSSILIIVNLSNGFCVLTTSLNLITFTFEQLTKTSKFLSKRKKTQSYVYFN